jgi:hypothetical protein
MRQYGARRNKPTAMYSVAAIQGCQETARMPATWNSGDSMSFQSPPIVRLVADLQDGANAAVVAGACMQASRGPA